jgi:hypothetical protein
LRVKYGAATLTDTSSSGTVAAVYADAHKAATLAASNATTYTAAYGCYFEAPLAGSNVTLSAAWALGADSAKINGPITATSIQFGTGTALSTYQEGTWPPTDASGASLSLTVNSASYRKVGKLVYVDLDVTYPANANGSQAKIGGLPFAPTNTINPLAYYGAGTGLWAIAGGGTTLNLYSFSTAAVTNATLSGQEIRASFTYSTSS